MLFTTDKQTLEDLNIFGRHGSDSVFGLFDKTSTRGGSGVLKEMFNDPFSDASLINFRSGVIRYLAKNNATFPFLSADLDVAEQYLSNTDERSRLVARPQSLLERLRQKVMLDTEYIVIYKGVTTVLRIVQNLQEYISTYSLSSDGHLQKFVALMAGLLSNTELTELASQKQAGVLTYKRVAECDNILRFRQRSRILQLIGHIYVLDAYITVARVAVEKGFTFPVALPKKDLKFNWEGIYHPLVKNAVPNNISITPDNNVIFLTGANMAGKSTFMKALGITILLAHMGFPVAAAKMEFSVLDSLFTTINLPDNLGMGASHFYAEVMRVKKVALELQRGRNLFVVFDELFRGTNVKDAYEATIAITEAFAQKNDSIFIISTHIIEAGGILKERCKNINFLYLPTQMKVQGPVYTYALEPGITEDRHGMVIVEKEGILEILNNGNIFKTNTL